MPLLGFGAHELCLDAAQTIRGEISRLDHGPDVKTYGRVVFMQRKDAAKGEMMPRVPKGEKRPADVIGNAVHVMRIATRETEEAPRKFPNRAKGGRKGGKARAASLTAEQRSQIAHAAAAARWKKN
jgi:hypothetical protein